MSEFTDAYDWRDREVVDSDGEKIGKVDEVYLATANGEPEWLSVNTGLFGMKSSFVPLQGADPSGGSVRVAYTKDEVKDAPNIASDAELSTEEEQRLWSHYGLDYDAGYNGTNGIGDEQEPVGRDTSGPETDNAMTRSEEEVNVGTREREKGRARLRKYVVTEEVTKTVPVRKEKAVLEREPITEGCRRRPRRPGDLRRGARGDPQRGGGRGRKESRAEGAGPPRQGDRGLRAAGQPQVRKEQIETEGDISR